MKHKFILIFLLNFPGFINIHVKAQSATDSLIAVIKKSAGDTNQVKAYNTLASLYLFNNPDTARILCNRALELASKIKIGKEQGWLKEIAFSNHLLGSVNYLQGDFNTALNYYTTAFEIRKKLNDKQGMAKSILNIGTVHRERGDYAKAINSYYEALKINEALNDKAGLELNMGNIASIYYNQKKYPEALETFHKALKIAREVGNKDHESSWLGSIGNVYMDLKENEKALDYFNQALKLCEVTGNASNISLWLGNIGNVYRNKGDYNTALEYYYKGLKMKEQLGDKKSITLNLINIGSLYTDMKKFDKAHEYLHRSLALAKELDAKSLVRDNYYYLIKLDSVTGKYKDAFNDYKLYIRYRDTVDNEEVRKQNLRTTMQYDYDKKQAIAEAQHRSEMDKQAAVSKEEARRKNFIIIAATLGLFLVIVFAVFMYNRFRITQKQKQIIEQKEKETREQKSIIEEKHQEITDSINYAERIQRSFLASGNLLDTHLSDYFVFYKPRNIVSGDFYWAAVLNNGHFALMAADSTGHGVPGAIMSLLNITSLEKAIETTNEPANILNYTRQTIIERLKRDGSDDGGKDGMDCTLIVLNKNKSVLNYAAANNPLWIVREGNMLEFAADKMPVGKHDKDQQPFIQTQVELKKGDMVYIFTDGFADQFGGPKGKKFMYKPLKELLVSVSALPTGLQQEELQRVFINWKGNLEQVDDVCVIGIRI